MENPLCRLKSKFSGQILCVFGVIYEKNYTKNCPPKNHPLGVSLLQHANKMIGLYSDFPQVHYHVTNSSSMNHETYLWWHKEP
jgi:hypothetical protein